MVYDKICKIICDQLKIDASKVTPDSYFVDDLGADSLDIMEMIMAFEDELGFEVSEESLENVRQVKDVVEYFEKNGK